MALAKGMSKLNRGRQGLGRDPVFSTSTPQMSLDSSPHKWGPKKKRIEMGHDVEKGPRYKDTVRDVER